MSYPTTANVSAHLEGQGLTVPENLSGILAGVIKDWERRIGGGPFLAQNAASSKTYDPPYRDRDYILDLECGFISVSGITIDSVTVASTEYDLLPLDAPEKGEGYTQVRFKFHPGTLQSSVIVSGVKGRYSECPADVFDAILNHAAGKAIPAGVQGVGVASTIKQGPVTLNVGAGDSGMAGKSAAWEKEFRSLITGYRFFP